MSQVISGDAPAFSAYPSSSQNITSSTVTKILFQTEEFDISSSYDISNSVFQPSVAGYYQVSAAIQPTNTAAGGCTIYLYFMKNGVSVKQFEAVGSSGTQCPISASGIVYLNGSTDTLHISIFQTVAATATTNSASDRTFFQACLIRGV